MRIIQKIHSTACASLGCSKGQCDCDYEVVIKTINDAYDCGKARTNEN